MKSKLLRQKVAFAVDTDAEKASTAVGKVITSGSGNTDLKGIAESTNATSGATVTFGSLGWVLKTNQDGGLAAAASLLTVGQVSTAIKSTTGDGYYYVKLVDINDTQVNYEFIHIPLTLFTEQVEKVESKKYIKLTDVTPTNKE